MITMKTTFGQEILTRKVVDSAGDLLGHLADFSIDGTEYCFIIGCH